MVKKIFSIFLIFLMMFFTVHTGILGIKQVYAEDEKEIITVRVEGPDYTILPETYVEIKKGETSEENILKSVGLKKEGNSINGVLPKTSWRVIGRGTKEILYTTASFSIRSTLIGPLEAEADKSFEVVLKDKSGEPGRYQEIKYYRADEYDYKGVNIKGIKPKSTGIKTDECGKAKIKLPVGRYFITADRENMTRAKACEVEVQKPGIPKVKTKVRVEGTDYTILPETEIEITENPSIIKILKMAGLKVLEKNGNIDMIQETRAKPKWCVSKYKNDIVLNGNGTQGRTNVTGPSQVKEEEEFQVSLKDQNGKAIKDAELKYYIENDYTNYTESNFKNINEYDYNGFNAKRVKPRSLGIKTDKNGNAKIKLKMGKYFITAEKKGMPRAKALQVDVQNEYGKLNIIFPKHIIKGSAFEVKVVDSKGNPVRNIEVAGDSNKNFIHRCPNESIYGKTDNNGKLVIDGVDINTIDYFYCILLKDGIIKSNIQKCKVIDSKYYIYITPEKWLIKVEETTKFNVDVNKEDVENEIKWESEDKSIATVDANGNVKGIKKGKTFIRAILKHNPEYYKRQSIEVANNIMKVHLRVEQDYETHFSKDVNISGEERSLEDLLTTNKWVSESYHMYEPKFNDKGKITELSQRLKGTPVYSVKINGKVKENHRDAKIKDGDDIVCSYNGAVNELSVYGVTNTSICGKYFDITVKDEKGNPVENAHIVVGWERNKEMHYFEPTKHGTTDKKGKNSIKLDIKGKYYIKAEKDGYIRSKAKFTQAELPDIQLSYPQQVYNDENFDMRLTIGEKNVNIAEAKNYWLKTENKHIPFDRNSKLFGTTNDEGKASGKIEAPIGEYSLVLDFYKNKVNMGKIKILDRHKYQSTTVARMNKDCKASTAVKIDDKIYLFGADCIKSFNVKNNEIKNIWDLPKRLNVTGSYGELELESALVGNKIYLFSNEKVYEYNIKNNKMIEIADLPKGYRILGRGTAVVDNKVYIYERKKDKGAIVEFDINKKSSNIVCGIDIEGWRDYNDTGDLDGCRIVNINKKLYIIGECKYCPDKIYEFNIVNREIRELEISNFHNKFQYNSPININGKIYIINDYNLCEINFKNKTIKNIGYAPKSISRDMSILVDNTVYVFEKNCKNQTEGDIIKITGFLLEDKEKPEIIIEGINDGTVVDKKEIPITVNVDDNIIPIVKCNDKEISIRYGKYNLDLNNGSNLIEVTATDKSGNTEIKKYKLIYNGNIVPNKIVIEGAKERLHPKDKITLKSKMLDKQNNVIPCQEVIFTSSDKKVATIDEKTGEVTAIGNGTVILTAQLKDNKNIKETVKIKVTDKYKVYVRIEGYNHTILPRKEIEVGLFDLSPYLGKASGSSATESSGWKSSRFKRPSNAHAIVKALVDAEFKQEKGGEDKTDKLFDLQDYGWSLYIAMIGGDREHDHGGMSGWLYRVNDNLPSMGCADIPLNDEDEIVWMYSPYGFDNVYTKLQCDKKEVSVNDKVNIKLNGYTGGYQKVSETVGRATILVNDKPYKINGQKVITNARGNATLTFDKQGDYTISAIREDEKGLIDIIRPNPIVIHVKGNKNNKFEISKIGKVVLEKGSNGEVKFSIKNNDNKDRKVTLLVVLYDKNTHEMKDYSYIKKVLKVGEKELLVSGLMIPNDGEYEAKAIVCDDLNIEKMNLLYSPVNYKVK